MSDRCEPPPELRGVDGDFWLERAGVPSVHVWLASPQCWIFSGVRDVRPGNMHALGWRYISPVATPAEVEALRAERDILAGSTNELGAALAITAHENTTLRARVARLEPGPPLSSCLDELAALITTQAGCDALSVALERARRALEGGV